MAKHEIRSIGGAVLFTAEVPDDTPGGLAVRVTLEQATKSRANLCGADLGGAYLSGAYLRGADLRGAYLSGADLGEGVKLVGDRPVLQAGPIGSRADYLLAFLTTRGVMVRAGCFFDTLDQFELACAETHGDGVHAQEYKAACALIAQHAKLWAPATEEAQPVGATVTQED